MEAPKAAVSASPLQRNVIGLREVFFQAVTHTGPAISAAFAIALGAAYFGGSLPLAVVLAMIGILICAISFGELSRHIPSAGGLYAYIARSLHPRIGFLIAWAYSLAEPLVVPAVLGLLGTLTASTLNSEFGWPTGMWWVWYLVGAVIVYLLNIFGIRVGARTGSILGLLEFAVFVVLSLWLIVKAGHANTLSVFSMHYATIKGYEGASGLFAALVFVYLSFTGFEGAAPLAEEAEQPRRIVRLALIFSVLAVGVFFILTTYASTVYFGPSRMAGLPVLRERQPVDADRAAGLGHRLGAYLPGPAQLLHRQHQRRGAGGLAHPVLDGPHPRAAVLVRACPPPVGVPVRGPDLPDGRRRRRGDRGRPGLRRQHDLRVPGHHPQLDHRLHVFPRLRWGASASSSLKSVTSSTRSCIVVIPVLGICLIVPAWLTAVGIPVFQFITPLA